jgi:hypothetical protein
MGWPESGHLSFDIDLDFCQKGAVEEAPLVWPGDGRDRGCSFHEGCGLSVGLLDLFGVSLGLGQGVLRFT